MGCKMSKSNNQQDTTIPLVIGNRRYYVIKWS
jgi:hypothetical protein